MKEPGQSRALSLPDPTTAHHPPVRNRLKPCEHVINKRTWRGRRRHARQETPGCRALSGSDIEVPLVASVAISLPASMLRCVTTPSNEATTCWHVFGCDDTIAASFGYGRWSLAQTGTTPERLPTVLWKQSSARPQLWSDGRLTGVRRAIQAEHAAESVAAAEFPFG